MNQSMSLNTTGSILLSLIKLDYEFKVKKWVQLVHPKGGEKQLRSKLAFI